MKLAAFVAAALLAFNALAADPAPAATAATKPASRPATTATAVIPVKGMSCGGCVARVDEALGKIAGVRRVETSLEDARTTVEYDPAQVKLERLVDAIAALGYETGAPAAK